MRSIVMRTSPRFAWVSIRTWNRFFCFFFFIVDFPTTTF
jgi:hypothetical protein